MKFTQNNFLRLTKSGRFFSSIKKNRLEISARREPQILLFFVKMKSFDHTGMRDGEIELPWRKIFQPRIPPDFRQKSTVINIFFNLEDLDTLNHDFNFSRLLLFAYESDKMT